MPVRLVRYESRSAARTKRIAEDILRSMLPKRDKRALVLALVGELGSGKTTFVQGLARALGIKEKVKSPTFVLSKWYKLRKKNPVFRYFVHVDAYRLGKISEAKHLGLPEIFKDKEAIVAVEWAERVERLVPKNAIWVRFQHKTKNTRAISLKMSND
ncbi:MAG: tRNA (adenosine(37)-N6)-threonylcarbamoyltransferase complex ATPase subunit type 1 TsaE [Candidatus Sungbacteria bacterium]|nr:tRNA (adenosine(37)-N6)-threonylcarbamoyltransferase complex ATPase subunit type 1 TsaE [Candidatus Sungbacteria bacterium]